MDDPDSTLTVTRLRGTKIRGAEEKLSILSLDDQTGIWELAQGNRERLIAVSTHEDPITHFATTTRKTMDGQRHIVRQSAFVMDGGFLREERLGVNGEMVTTCLPDANRQTAFVQRVEDGVLVSWQRIFYPRELHGGTRIAEPVGDASHPPYPLFPANDDFYLQSCHLTETSEQEFLNSAVVFSVWTMRLRTAFASNIPGAFYHVRAPGRSLCRIRPDTLG